VGTHGKAVPARDRASAPFPRKSRWDACGPRDRQPGERGFTLGTLSESRPDEGLCYEIIIASCVGCRAVLRRVPAHLGDPFAGRQRGFVSASSRSKTPTIASISARPARANSSRRCDRGTHWMGTDRPWMIPIGSCSHAGLLEDRATFGR
jgi:hypothetical protein